MPSFVPLPSIRALLIAVAVASTSPAIANEAWQLRHGPFVTASDVTSHNKMPLDIKGVTDAITAAKPDWPAALRVFAFGGNFAGHSLAKFTDNYNGRFPEHIAAATAFHGSPSYMNHALNAALAGTGRFASSNETARVRFVEAGLMAAVINWARYELGESRRKGTAPQPN